MNDPLVHKIAEHLMKRDHRAPCVYDTAQEILQLVQEEGGIGDAHAPEGSPRSGTVRAGTASFELADKPPVGSLWRDHEGNTWRLHHYNNGGPWCQLRGVLRFDGEHFDNAAWHCDWMLDLVRKAEPVTVASTERAA